MKEKNLESLSTEVLEENQSAEKSEMEMGSPMEGGQRTDETKTMIRRIRTPSVRTINFLLMILCFRNPDRDEKTKQEQ